MSLLVNLVAVQDMQCFSRPKVYGRQDHSSLRLFVYSFVPGPSVSAANHHLVVRLWTILLDVQTNKEWPFRDGLDESP